MEKTSELKPDENFISEENKALKKVVDEIDANKEFYKKAKPEEKLEALIKNCNLSVHDIYIVMKKCIDINKL